MQCVAYVGNIVSTDESCQTAFSSPGFFNFDHAGVGLGFHHMDDCALAAKRLAQGLRPGGVFFVVDFAAQETASEQDLLPSSSGVRHQGFMEQEMQHMFEVAGVGFNFAFHVLDEDLTFEHAHGQGKHMYRRVFIARGEKKGITGTGCCLRRVEVGILKGFIDTMTLEKRTRQREIVCVFSERTDFDRKMVLFVAT